ncbi:MAG: GH92 family glycosyl hydrolase [Muribaculaceae bacterium]|nr:GH92 family glycosyl hydrolase [Muribaculaceae bacterium]
MKRRYLTILCLGTLLLTAQARSLTDYVNPLIGTALKGEGGTAPFVGPPHAMTKMMPQTRENKMGTMAYVYDDTCLMGIMASHQPTVWMGDYGYVSIMPQQGERILTLPGDRALPYSHQGEHATPHLYTVALTSQEGKPLKAEVAASSRCALLKVTFGKSAHSRIIVQGINLNPGLADWSNDYGPRMATLRGWVKIDPDRNEIIGYNPDRQSAQLGPELKNFKGYFVIKFDKSITQYGTWTGDDIHPASSEEYGTRMGAYVEFATPRATTVSMQMGTSFISIDQARANMEQELPGWNLAALSRSTRSLWEAKLGKIKVQATTHDEMVNFYTALYHSYLFPREFSEGGRYYSAFDDQVHEGNSHNDFSLWDTFRALHPLMTLLEPDLTCQWITSLLQMYQQGGWLPIWPNPGYTNIMIGTHADAVIADAYMKGLRNYDTALAYEAMRKNAMVPPDGDTFRRYGDRDRWTAFQGRAGASYYHSLGYVPDDRTAESLSRTLEYAYDDWCVAQLARDLGTTHDYDQLLRWSQNYRNVYNSERGFMLPRNYNGDWIDLDDHNRRGLTEGSKWTYLFCVLQDIPGMIDMMGGRDAFARMLDRNFDENHYRHDNEPGHHYIYLYDYCGQPWKCQQLVRQHTTANYRNAPDGINGNDDCGQMSAWYIFSVMGFYPVTPGSNTYALGAPQFERVTLQLEQDTPHDLTIEARGLSQANCYVQRVEVDGRTLTEPFITHDALLAARHITFVMAPTPSYK